MRRLLSFAAATVVLGSPAAAGDVAPAGAKPVAEKKTCRSTGTTGSIRVKKVCHTKAQWRALDEQNGSRAARDFDERDRGLTNPGGSAPGAS